MDIYSSIKPLYVLSKTFTLAQLSLIGDIGNRRFQVSRRATAIAYCGIVLYALCSYVAVNDIVKQKYDYVLSCLMDVSVVVSDASLIALAVNMNVKNAKLFISVMSQIRIVDAYFEKKTMTSVYLNSKHFVRVEICCISLSLAVALSVYIHQVTTSNHPGFTNCVSWAIFFAPRIVSTVLIMQFVNLLLLLKQRFGLVNKELSRCTDTPPDGSQIAVNQLRELHAILCGLAQVVNDMYSPQLLMLTASAYIQLTSQCNYCISDVIKLYRKEYKSISLRYVTVDLYIIPLTVLMMSVIVQACTRTSEEVSYYPNVVIHT